MTTNYRQRLYLLVWNNNKHFTAAESYINRFHQLEPYSDNRFDIEPLTEVYLNSPDYLDEEFSDHQIIYLANRLIDYPSYESNHLYFNPLLLAYFDQYESRLLRRSYYSDRLVPIDILRAALKIIYGITGADDYELFKLLLLQTVVGGEDLKQSIDENPIIAETYQWVRIFSNCLKILC